MTNSSWFRIGSRQLRKSKTRPVASRRPLVESLEGRSLLSTITVTLATDPATTHTGTSLRDAITQVDAGKYTTIGFNIPTTAAGPQAIAVTSPLPTITKPVTIDGTTEPGYAGKPLVALTRANPTVTGYGLMITGGGTTVKGLSIYGFTGYGIHIQTGGGNTVVADYLGVNLTGTIAPGNVGGGLWLDNSSGNTIGGTVASSRNIIGGNGGIVGTNDEGIRVDGGSIGNTITGNSIGTDLTGALNLANLGNGISIASSGGVTANTITNNTIANSGVYGIGLNTATNVVIQGNSVSTSYHRGIAVINSSKVTIGGTASTAANTINANGLKDGDVNSYAAGIAVVNGSTNVTVTGNTITGNGRGIRVSGAGAPGTSPSITITNNKITGNATQGVFVDNFFGGSSQNVLFTGDTIQSNGGAGLRVDYSSNILIGQAAATVNDIEYNGTNGIALDYVANVVLINNIASSNTGDGILISTGSTGVTLPSANTVKNNGVYGVEDLSTTVSLPSTTTNTITGNTKGNVSNK